MLLTKSEPNGTVSVLPKTQADRVDRVKAYHAASLKSAQDLLGYRFLVGAELLALKGETPYGQFEKLKATEFPHISGSALSRCIAFAQAIQSKYPTVGYLEPAKLLTDGNGEFDPVGKARILKAVYEAADGKSVTEFMRDLGIIRPPQPLGRKPGEKPKRLTLSEQAELRKAQATEDWTALSRSLTVYADKFLLLSDADIEAQISVLNQALTARKTWLKQPKAARDPKPIAALFEK